jgi:hypothetical protein
MLISPLQIVPRRPVQACQKVGTAAEPCKVQGHQCGLILILTKSCLLRPKKNIPRRRCNVTDQEGFEKRREDSEE